MEISDIKLEMELAGVDSVDITEIVNLYCTKEFSSELIDNELLKRGYEKIFDIDYDAYDDWEDDDGYAPIEKFQHKQHYRD